MYKLIANKNYSPKMNLRETERAIKLLKDAFERVLANSLNLERISAPILVTASSGINDDLTGVERAVKFDLKEIPGFEAEIVQSLAKWKRIALHEYGFNEGEGLYTDMNAIRRDDSIDNIHSIYVDQWDWELIINKQQRTLEYLKTVVQKIVNAIVDAQNIVKKQFPCVTTNLSKNVFFITSQELLDMFPDLTAKEREHRITKDKGTVFIMQIGGKLTNGLKHDNRAPDYDDWGLNGDLLFWNELTGESIEISSMGIRVDGAAMQKQLTILGETKRAEFDYHRRVINDRLPYTIGGGIGQSRLCLLILQKLHIGEVQVSVWPNEMKEECVKAGIILL